MRKRILPLLFGLLAIPVFLFAQKQPALKDLSVYVSPALVSIGNTELALQPGLQYQIQKWSIGGEIAFALHKPLRKFETIHYTRFGAEVKYHWKATTESRPYISLQGHYGIRDFSDTSSGTFFRKSTADEYQYSQAYIQSPILAIAVRVGIEREISNRLYIDGFFGLGNRTIYTSYSNIKDEAPVPPRPIRIHIAPSSYRFDKTIAKPHAVIGFRIGYRIKT